MIKIVFFDVDGTLVSPTLRRVPDSARRAIKELQKRGILCYLATGRHPNNIKGIGVEEIGFDGVVGLNGQMATDKDGNVLFSVEMSKKDQEIIVENFNKKTHPMVIIENNQQYFNFLNETVISFRERFKLPMPTVHEYTGNPILQSVIYMSEEEEGPFMDQFNCAKSARWNSQGFDIINANGGKDIGIMKLLDVLNIKPEETMAFGDNHNDLEMLQYVKIGVAMGNSIDGLKDVADYVTDDVDSDGIYNALRHYRII